MHGFKYFLSILHADEVIVNLCLFIYLLCRVLHFGFITYFEGEFSV